MSDSRVADRYKTYISNLENKGLILCSTTRGPAFQLELSWLMATRYK